jgi:hypothetical protein
MPKTFERNLIRERRVSITKPELSQPPFQHPLFERPIRRHVDLPVKGDTKRIRKQKSGY